MSSLKRPKESCARQQTCTESKPFHWKYASPLLSSPLLLFPFFSSAFHGIIQHMANFSQSMTLARYTDTANSYSIFIWFLENHQCPFSFDLYFVSEHHNVRELFLVSQEKFSLAGNTLLKDYSKVATTVIVFLTDLHACNYKLSSSPEFGYKYRR